MSNDKGQRSVKLRGLRAQRREGAPAEAPPVVIDHMGLRSETPQTPTLGDHVRCTCEVLTEHRGRGGFVEAVKDQESLVALDGTSQRVWFFNKHLRVLQRRERARSECPACDGFGKILEPVVHGAKEHVTCPRCRGAGFVETSDSSPLDTGMKHAQTRASDEQAGTANAAAPSPGGAPKSPGAICGDGCGAADFEYRCTEPRGHGGVHKQVRKDGACTILDATWPQAEPNAGPAPRFPGCPHFGAVWQGTKGNEQRICPTCHRVTSWECPKCHRVNAGGAKDCESVSCNYFIGERGECSPGSVDLDDLERRIETGMNTHGDYFDLIAEVRRLRGGA